MNDDYTAVSGMVVGEVDKMVHSSAWLALMKSMRLRSEWLSRRAIRKSMEEPEKIFFQGTKGISDETEADLRTAASLLLAVKVLEEELQQPSFIARL